MGWAVADSESHGKARQQGRAGLWSPQGPGAVAGAEPAEQRIEVAEREKQKSTNQGLGKGGGHRILRPL